MRDKREVHTGPAGPSAPLLNGSGHDIESGYGGAGAGAGAGAGGPLLGAAHDGPTRPQAASTPGAMSVESHTSAGGTRHSGRHRGHTHAQDDQLPPGMPRAVPVSLGDFVNAATVQTHNLREAEHPVAKRRAGTFKTWAVEPFVLALAAGGTRSTTNFMEHEHWAVKAAFHYITLALSVGWALNRANDILGDSTEAVKRRVEGDTALITRSVNALRGMDEDKRKVVAQLGANTKALATVGVVTETVAIALFMFAVATVPSSSNVMETKAPTLGATALIVAGVGNWWRVGNAVSISHFVKPGHRYGRELNNQSWGAIGIGLGVPAALFLVYTLSKSMRTKLGFEANPAHQHLANLGLGGIALFTLMATVPVMHERNIMRLTAAGHKVRRRAGELSKASLQQAWAKIPHEAISLAERFVALMVASTLMRGSMAVDASYSFYGAFIGTIMMIGIMAFTARRQLMREDTEALREERNNPTPATTLDPLVVFKCPRRLARS